MANFEAKVTAKGQITLPAKLRAKLGVEPGDAVLFSESGDGGFRIETRRKTLGDLTGIIKTGPAFTSTDFALWLEKARGRGLPRDATEAEKS
jgi:antitoxin PrlF